MVADDEGLLGEAKHAKRKLSALHTPSHHHANHHQRRLDSAAQPAAQRAQHSARPPPAGSRDSSAQTQSTAERLGDALEAQLPFTQVGVLGLGLGFRVWVCVCRVCRVCVLLEGGGRGRGVHLCWYIYDIFIMLK